MSSGSMPLGKVPARTTRRPAQCSEHSNSSEASRHTMGDRPDGNEIFEFNLRVWILGLGAKVMHALREAIWDSLPVLADAFQPPG